MEGQIAPNKKGPSRVEATGDEDIDLSEAAAKVKKADKPHDDPPGELSVVLFADLDKASAKKAVDALGKVKGIDGKRSKADADKGEISVKLAGGEVKLAGGEKLTVAALVDALKDAGIKASTSKAAEKKKKEKN